MQDGCNVTKEFQFVITILLQENVRLHNLHACHVESGLATTPDVAPSSAFGTRFGSFISPVSCFTSVSKLILWKGCLFLSFSSLVRFRWAPFQGCHFKQVSSSIQRISPISLQMRHGYGTRGHYLGYSPQNRCRDLLPASILGSFPRWTLDLPYNNTPLGSYMVDATERYWGSIWFTWF